MFQHLEPYAGDPILSLNEAFQADPRPHKVNLSIGIYFDDAGRIPVLDCVRQAEAQLLEAAGPKPYLPMEGAAPMRRAVQALLFGPAHEAVTSGRVATLQTVGSSGGLKVGADFLRRWFPGSAVWVSDPTWDNHRAVFEGAGLSVHTYPYYDAATGGLAFDAMCEALDRLPPRSVVLLHACCHNPTGCDLTAAQWAQVVQVVRERGLVAFLDMAYQGFGDGIAEDGAVVGMFLASGVDFLVASSFSKSFSLYGERVGALSVVCASAPEAARVLSQLKIVVRTNYSNPPTHGATIVATVLTTPALRAQWEDELGAMRVRIRTMRQALVDGLQAAGVRENLDHITRQKGMFSYSGLSREQMLRLREEFAVYGLDSGRICVAALNQGNLPRVIQALVAVMGASVH